MMKAMLSPVVIVVTSLEIMRRLVWALATAALPACASTKDTTVFYNAFYNVFYDVIIPLCCVSS